MFYFLLMTLSLTNAHHKLPETKNALTFLSQIAIKTATSKVLRSYMVDQLDKLSKRRMDWIGNLLNNPVRLLAVGLCLYLL